MRAFVPRYVASSPPDLWRALAVLEIAWPESLVVPLHFYAAAAADALLWEFTIALRAAPRRMVGDKVAVSDVLMFLDRAPATRFGDGRWSDDVATKVARGVLVALRDFGVLAGRAHKYIATPHLPIESFAFLARVRSELGVRGGGPLRDPCWALFDLDEHAVERCFLQAHQLGYLSYHAAGSLVRVAFPAGSIEDYARALAQRSHSVVGARTSA